MDQTQETNEARVRRAQTAIDVYLGLHGSDPDNPVRDLLADLMHLCGSRGIDFAKELDMATTNYECEK